MTNLFFGRIKIYIYLCINFQVKDNERTTWKILLGYVEISFWRFYHICNYERKSTNILDCFGRWSGSCKFGDSRFFVNKTKGEIIMALLILFGMAGVFAIGVIIYALLDKKKPS